MKNDVDWRLGGVILAEAAVLTRRFVEAKDHPWTISSA